MRLLLIAVLPFSLWGCWTGSNLYSASDARAAIPGGVYNATAPDQLAHIYRISTLANGMTQFDGGDEKEIVGFAPLDVDHGVFVVWEEPERDLSVPRSDTDDNQTYALMV